MKYKSVISVSICLLILAGTTLNPSAFAQVLFSSGSYSQNFDTLDNTGTSSPWTDNTTLLGWYAWKTNNTTVGPTTVSTYVPNDGASTAGALYSYGVTGNSDRALGSISSGNAAAGDFVYGVRFTNDTAQAISNIMVSYTGEQWRNGGNTATQTLAFTYRISNTPFSDPDPLNVNVWTAVSALDFKTPNVGTTATKLDGNASNNRQVLSNILLPGASVLPGQEIFLRWFDINDSGNDHAVAVDDFSITFSLVTAVTNPVAITPGGQPLSRTNNAGTIATFTVSATGTTPTFKWRKDGFDLNDGGRIYGTETTTLVLSNVLASEIGGYDVVVANGLNSVTSQVATLTVIDPAINTQPVSRSSIAGDNANFFVSAAGTPGLTYQWRLNGGDLPTGTAATYNVLNVQSGNQGAYTVVVSNGNGGSITSAVANLTLLNTPSNLLARWDFNDTNNLVVTAPAPSSGSGSAALLNGATAAFGAGGTFSDPAGPPGAANSGWNTTTYAGQGASNKVRGVQFNVSTVGNQNILLTWEQRHSDTASKYCRLQYTSDGNNFVDGPVITMTATNNTFVFYSADLSGISAINNNANFGFRIVEEWESSAIGTQNDNYVATVSSYGTSGTIRFDLVTVFGNVYNPAASPIPLGYQRIGTNLVLSWNNAAFALQSATSVTGVYSTIVGATSPYTNPISGPQKFFRLRQ